MVESTFKVGEGVPLQLRDLANTMLVSPEVGQTDIGFLVGCEKRHRDGDCVQLKETEA